MTLTVLPKKKQNLISMVTTGASVSGLKGTMNFFNANINISHDLGGALHVNWGLADWFLFFTRAVERQFNFLSSSLPPGMLHVFFCFLLPEKKKRKSQHDFVSFQHILCADRFYLTSIYKKEERIPAVQCGCIITLRVLCLTLRNIIEKNKHLNETKPLLLDSRIMW